MINLKKINPYLKYPLMWVMLLWALTLPGHEVLVYGFMVKGNLTEAASDLAAAPAEGIAVKKQAVQAFTDANTSSSIIISPQTVARYLLPVFSFAPPANEALPAAYAAQAAAMRLMALLISVTIQPNAP